MSTEEFTNYFPYSDRFSHLDNQYSVEAMLTNRENFASLYVMAHGREEGRGPLFAFGATRKQMAPKETRMATKEKMAFVSFARYPENNPVLPERKDPAQYPTNRRLHFESDFR